MIWYCAKSTWSACRLTSRSPRAQDHDPEETFGISMQDLDQDTSGGWKILIPRGWCARSKYDPLNCQINSPRLAQSVERETLNLGVAGSSP